MGADRKGALGRLLSKGDILALLADGTVERLAVGANDEVLVADSAEATGLRYQTLGSFGIGAGTTFPYGGDIKTSGNYYTAHGTFTAGESVALDEESQIVMTFAGKIAQLSWIGDAADATTILRIVINGIVVDTITLTGSFGSVALNGTTFALGDRVAIQYGDGVVGPTSGTKPGKGTASLGVQKI